MKVKRLILREVGTYNDMTLRPFVTNFDRRDIDNLAEATDDGKHLTVSNLAGVTIGMLRPTAEAHGVAPIASGWGEKRLMFLMECTIQEGARNVVTEIICGYTDHLGISNLTGRKINLDNKMKFYFNSTFAIRRILGFGARGNEWSTNAFDSAQVVTRTSRSDLSRFEGEGTMTMRPEDVIVRNSVPEEFHEIAGRENFRDTRSEFGRGALKLSSRDNTSSAQYLSKTLSALRDSADDDFLEVSDAKRLSEARGMVRERSITNDRVFEELNQDSAIMSDGFVTWGDLVAMNPNLDAVTDVFMNDNTAKATRRGDSENWGGSDNETLAATIISNAMPRILIELMYGEVEFTCTNDTRGGVFETKVGRLIPFVPETDIDENYNMLISRIEHELMSEVLFNKMMSVFVHVKCSIYGNTTITIAFDGEPDAVFDYPTFADSVASPIITNRRDILDTMAHDISTISRQLGEARASSSGGSGSTKGKRHI